MIASIITCYGLPHLTDGVVKDLMRDGFPTDIFIVDNQGDYECQYESTDDIKITILRPGVNLRWTRGMNYGLGYARNTWGYEAYVLFNNDVRLSPNFLAGLYDAHMVLGDKLGLLAPAYDDVYEQQKGWYRGNAYSYKPEPVDNVVNLVDGTLFYITAEALNEVGVLDAETFGVTGWGGDLDYCHRIKQAGFDVAVTFRSYINHFHQGTVKVVFGDWNSIAGPDMEQAMNSKYGPGWRDIIYKPLD